MHEVVEDCQILLSPEQNRPPRYCRQWSESLSANALYSITSDLESDQDHAESTKRIFSVIDTILANLEVEKLFVRSMYRHGLRLFCRGE
nr:hypothetical protein CFP56_70200 [Quercus suber]